MVSKGVTMSTSSIDMGKFPIDPTILLRTTCKLPKGTQCS